MAAIVDYSKDYRGNPQSYQFAALIKKGTLETPDTTEVRTLDKNTAGDVTAAIGETVPTVGESGFAKDCEFTDSNATDGEFAKYYNVGDETSCDFRTPVDMAGDEAREVTGYNSTGGTFVKGTQCYISGYDTTSGNPIMSVADKNTQPASYVATADILTLTSGVFQKLATVSGLNTAAGIVGQDVYLGDNGAWTLTQPVSTDELEQVVGQIQVSHASTGSILFDLNTPITKIGSNQYRANSVNNAAIADDAVTPEKLAYKSKVLWFEDFHSQNLISNGALATKDTSAAGTPTLAGLVDTANGVFRLAFDNTNEAQILTLYGNNDLKWDIDDDPIFYARFRVQALNANDMFVVGLAGDQNDVLDTVAQSVWVRFEGASMNMLAESDDGTTDLDDASMGRTLGANTWETIKIDCTNKADIRFYYLNGTVWQPLTSGGATFSLNAYTGNLQPFVQLQKSSGVQTTALDVDFLRIEAPRV